MERRGGNRVATRVALQARAGGRTFLARLYDVSRSGCQIDCSAAFVLSRGDKIEFRFSEEVSMPGKVAWRRGARAGVRFGMALPETIARHLNL